MAERRLIHRLCPWLPALFLIGTMTTPAPAWQEPATGQTAPATKTAPSAKTNTHGKTARSTQATPRGKAAAKPRGGLRISGAPVAKIRDQVEKKNAADRPELARSRDTQYYRIAIDRMDNSLINLNYYPALPGENPAVVLLVHEKDRSSRDFSDKIEDSKDANGLAAALQKEGFAVISLDIAGLTDPQKKGNVVTKDAQPKAAAKSAEAKASGNQVEQAVNDLKLTYQFMVDRHNRQEFNLGKLTLLTLGEGADAALEWIRESSTPQLPIQLQGRPNQRPNPADPRQKNMGKAIAGGAMDTATSRPSDVTALVLISPVDSWNNVKTAPTLKIVLEGSPVNVLVMGGSTDKATADTLKALKPIVERRESRLSKVETIETSLHGARFLRFEPGLMAKLNRFLEQTVEFQKTEWEPRYNLTPVAYRLEEAVSKSAAQTDARKAATADKPAEKAKSKTDEKPPAVPENKPKEEKPKVEASKEPAKTQAKEEAKPATEPAKESPKPATNPALKAQTGKN